MSHPCSIFVSIRLQTLDFVSGMYKRHFCKLQVPFSMYFLTERLFIKNSRLGTSSSATRSSLKCCFGAIFHCKSLVFYYRISKNSENPMTTILLVSLKGKVVVMILVYKGFPYKCQPECQIIHHVFNFEQRFLRDEKVSAKTLETSMRHRSENAASGTIWMTPKTD